jgi:hypothetical protein
MGTEKIPSRKCYCGSFDWRACGVRGSGGSKNDSIGPDNNNMNMGPSDINFSSYQGSRNWVSKNDSLRPDD